MTIANRLLNDRRLLLQLDGNNPALNYREFANRGITGNNADLPFSIATLLAGESIQFVGGLSAETLFEAPIEVSKVNSPENLVAQRTDAEISRRLTKMKKESELALNEQGVNVLYLGIGVLNWKEAPVADIVWKSPLVLVPVKLVEDTRRSKDDIIRYYIEYLDEEVEQNESLKEALKDRYKFELPDMPAWEEMDGYDDISGSWKRWIGSIKAGINGRDGWSVDDESTVLSFFSFSKFRMFKDLDPKIWCSETNPDATDLIRCLLRDGFKTGSSLLNHDESLCGKVDASQPLCVLDMDSSQAKVIMNATRTNCLVVEGPPGSGKSQTIANLIANAVQDGKKVLFVSEKMAALDVVHRRLQSVGLGPSVLELHGTKAKKNSFISSIKTALSVDQFKKLNVNFDPGDLDTVSNEITKWVEAVNTSHSKYGYAPIQLYGHLLNVYREFPGLEKYSNAYLGIEKKALVEYLDDKTLLSFGTAQDPGPELRHIVSIRELIKELGPPSNSVFRGINLLHQLTTSEINDLRELVKANQALVQELDGFLAGIRKNFDWIDDSYTGLQLSLELLNDLRELSGNPVLRLTNRNWLGDQAIIEKNIQCLIRIKEIKASWQTALLGQAWTESVLVSRASLSGIPDSWWNRLFSSKLKAAKSHLNSLLKSPGTRSTSDLLNISHAIVNYQEEIAVLKGEEAIMSSYFGMCWRGEDSEVEKLKLILERMVNLHTKVKTGRYASSLLVRLSEIGEPVDFSALFDECQQLKRRVLEKFNSFCQEFNLRTDIRNSIEHFSCQDLTAYFEKFQLEFDKLNVWVSYCIELGLLNNSRKSWFSDVLDKHFVESPSVIGLFQKIVWEHLLSVLNDERPVLGKFASGKLDSLVEAFNHKDKILSEYYRVQLHNKHATSVSKFSDIGKAGNVRQIINRRRIPPIRKVIIENFEALSHIKPVFLMSPLSVASFLEASPEIFDMVIFDEASQIEPIDAIGAILRAKQAIVVGDIQQMPPSNFFKRITSQDNTNWDEEDMSQASETESIMKLMHAQNAPSSSLKWHYRSRHESLIATSNRHFYDESLLVFPSSIEKNDYQGLKFQYLDYTQCWYEGQGINSNEAKSVAKAVLDFANKFPGRSLGVVAFNIKQCELIEKEVLLLARGNPGLNSFINRDCEESFFIKNLENIQGDERDAIFISVGYGKTLNGVINYTAFGTLNREGSEKRLNVLMTRAKIHNRVFSNFRAVDLDLSDSKSRALRVLKDFLLYAETGETNKNISTGGEFGSPFEREVEKELTSLGYLVEAQLGSLGYRIDLAIKHPAMPGRYVLAIECDGATYHSAKSARDRDRLRQAVLEGLGWKFYRIWSSNWFYNKKVELGKLTKAIDEAILNTMRLPDNHSANHSEVNSISADLVEFENITSDSISNGGLEFTEYAFVDTSSWRKYDDIFRLNGAVLDRYLLNIIDAEGPIHKEQVYYRITEFQGTRLGSRIEEHLSNHLHELILSKRVVIDSYYCMLGGKDYSKLQPRSFKEFPGRDPSLISPIEIEAGLKLLLANAFGVPQEELVKSLANRFGFKLTENVNAHFKSFIDNMVNKGRLLRNDGFVSLLLS